MGFRFIYFCLLLSVADGNVLRSATDGLNMVKDTSPQLTHLDKEIQTEKGGVRTDDQIPMINTTQRSNDVAYTNMSSELTHALNTEVEGGIRQKMEQKTRISDLQTDEKMNLNVNITDTLNTDPTVAFTAITRETLVALSIDQIVPFPNVITNIGGGYDDEVSIFRCPVKGLYQFTVTTRSRNGYTMRTQLIVGRQKTVVIESGATTYDMSTNTVLILVNKWDNVYVRVTYLSSTIPILAEWGTFSGYLIKKM